MQVQSDSQILAPGSPASSARIDDPAPMGGRMIAAGLEAGEPVIAPGPGPTDPADPDGARRPAGATNTLGPTLVAIAALVLYAATRFLTGIHDPLGVGLAAVPLFFAAAFLPRRRAMLIGLGTVLVTVIPAGFDHGDWSVIDAGIVAELAILALASLALRASMSRGPQRRPPTRPPRRPS